MVREVAPPGMQSTASAVHLGIRGITGAMGPIGIAYLSGHVSSEGLEGLLCCCVGPHRREGPRMRWASGLA